LKKPYNEEHNTAGIFKSAKADGFLNVKQQSEESLEKFVHFR
jgi:hypothetical protein